MQNFSCEQQTLWSDCRLQADLSVCSVHMSERTFTHVVAHLSCGASCHSAPSCKLRVLKIQFLAKECAQYWLTD